MTRAAALAVLAALVTGCRHPAPAPVIENRAAAGALASPYHGPITEPSLEAMMRQRFARQLAAGTFVADFNGTAADLLTELDAMGIHDLGRLAALIPPDYDRRAGADFRVDDPANIPGVLRDIFIIADARRYFRDAWQSHWQSVSTGTLPLYRSYHVDLDVLIEAGVITRDDAAAIDVSSP